ncbi:MAG TPA: pyruvate ferredoxin oxidoreductase [Verrucomicrobiales bacterium]|nr:pyruvate ferredoxin oxidoreductase [Verrucomicrobiales bacterium]
MINITNEFPPRLSTLKPAPILPESERKGLTKKETAADHPTWCPGCGDFSVLALYFKLIEKRAIWHEKITTVAGIGCSSRFPYFVQGHGVHFIHGRALPFATGLSLTRPDLHVFVFGGDGDAFSIGGNHLTHAARKNIKMTYVIMDNQVYGLTKKQTSPTSPLGFKSKTDMWGAIDHPINPVKQLVSAGATFIARTTSTNPKHVLEMMEAAMDHDGFSVIQCLSECVEFFEGAFDSANPRKGGAFTEVPADHDKTDEFAAYKLAAEPFPGKFGIHYQVQRETKNKLEADITGKAREKFKGLEDWQILQRNFDRMK